jgi:hypothetical protein
MVLQNKSHNSTAHHALQSCQIRMMLQNKSDNKQYCSPCKSDNSNRHALKWSNFRLNLSFRRCLSQKRNHFRENFLGNENFRETKFCDISRIFAHFQIIFAFRENGKTRFRFNPKYSGLHILYCRLKGTLTRKKGGSLYRYCVQKFYPLPPTVFYKSSPQSTR